MYRLLSNPYGETKTVQRLSDNAFIPFAEDNTDYQQYLKFLEEGGQPLPADAALDGSSE
jgi:hypothetical protein